MKKLFKVLVTIALSFTLQSCEKDTQIVPIENEDFYYARFEAVSSPYARDMRGTAIVGDQSVRFGYFESVKSFETTLGPVKYGDRASIYCDDSCISCCIYISKNNGPFALKASGRNSTFYKIEF